MLSVGAVYEKLRPGPGRPEPEVASHQRTRIHAAMIEIAAESGYDAVTVRKLTRLAHVSTGSFYKHFEDKEECFLSTYEQLVLAAARRMVSAQRAGQDWRERLRLGLRTLTEDVAAEPKAARLVLLEPFAVGPAASDRIARAQAISEAVVRASFNQGAGPIAIDSFLVSAIVAGATRVTRARLLAERVEALPELVDQLLEWACSLVGRFAEPPDPSPGLPADPDPDRETERSEGSRSAAGDERTLALAATAKLAAQGGYGALSTLRIRATAGVSRKSFQANFTGAEDCFLEAVEQLSESALTEATADGVRAHNWATGVHRTVAGLCARLAEDEVLSKLAFVEILAPGLSGIRRRERLVGFAAEHLRRSAPPAHRPARLAAEASTAAAWDAIHRQVRGEQAAQLQAQAPALALLLLAPPGERASNAGAPDSRSRAPALSEHPTTRRLLGALRA